MCGIVGVIGRNQVNTFQLDEIERMSAAQRHRGPDDSGMVGIQYIERKGCQVSDQKVFSGKSVLAFNRLSIQDLSEKGHQPMMNDNRDVVLAFNGEIYNFVKLREKLQQQGCKFKSKTDTEVILHLYLEYGIEKTLENLNGMFSIVIYDLRVGNVYIARDRFGIKPMYFCSTGDYYLFSSEVKSFLQFHEFHAALNEDILQEYILFRNVTKGTLFKSVEQVLPGEIYQISLDDSNITKYRFFSVNRYNRQSFAQYDVTDLRELLWETVRETIGRQMVSDVKVGCQLSGGIDSSLVSYIAAKEFGLNDTVSVVISDTNFSEEEYIDHVNDILHLNNHKLILDADYFVENYINAVWHFESIIVHSSTIGVYQIAEEATKCVTVLLSGEGADEVFGGYKTFLNTLDLPHDEIENAIIFGNGVLDSSTADKIFPGIDAEKQFQKRRDIYSGLQGSTFDKQVKYEMMTYLPEILVRQDKMSMAHSIENRVPMLDNRIVECAFQIPEVFLLNREKREGKDLLKQLCVPIFGESFAYRKKMGFGMPTNKFLATNPTFFYKVLNAMKKRDIINWNYMVERSRHIEELRGLDAELFFKMFGFEVWCQLFLDKKSMMEVMEG